MDVSVKTQTKTSITRKGDRIIIKEVETTTTTRKGLPPEVRVVERVKEYDVHNLPSDVKAQLGDFAAVDEPGTSKKVRKASSQGWIQSPARGSEESLERIASSVAPPTQIEANDHDSLNQDCVKCHNEYRAKHGVPPLSYSKELAHYAQNWAEELAINQRFEHRKQGEFGENLYMFYSSNPTVIATAEDACNSWYSEIRGYHFGKEPKNMSSGHFTQMIWKETKKVGMGRARGPTGKQIIVANYSPPGNFIGSFAANVPPPLF